MVAVKASLLASSEDLQRSSHNVSVVDGKAYVFGGELVPREPRDNKIFSISPNASTCSQVAVSGSAPTPRVGSASAVVGGKIYFFSGRGGIAMKPVEEHGALWVLDTTSSSWASIEPEDKSSSVPPARSYHCMTSDGKNTVFLHAGCPESGRLSDLWSFDISNKSWLKLADAPAPQRGGPSITYLDGKLYRMNGFDGNTEQGGKIDVYDIAKNEWSTINFEADGRHGPEARSVGTLLTLKVQGKDKLMTVFGEHDPSSLGHAGAGKMLNNCWLWDIESAQWEQADISGPNLPAPRGWFDADVIDDSHVVVVGGLSETNERLNDAWVLSF